MILFIKLLLAHLIGDFFLQTDSWIKDKERKKWRSIKLLQHVIIHGILERMFVFGFVISGYQEGIGFLLATKSVFRFGDLNEAKDRNLTEYVLIGTLISFSLAILVGVAFNTLIVQ